MPSNLKPARPALTPRPRATVRCGKLFLWIGAILALSAGGLLFWPGVNRVDPGLVLTMAAIPAPLLLLVGLMRSERWLRRERSNLDLMIVGRNRRTQDYVSQVTSDGRMVNIVGILDSEQTSESRCREELRSCDRFLDDRKIPYLGGHMRLHEVLTQRPVDEVLITLPIKSCYDEINHCLQVCQEAGIPASLPAHLFELTRPRPDLVSWPNGGLRLHYTRTRWPRWQVAIKRMIDIIGSGMALLLLGLPMLLIALAIKLTSQGPVLYWQQRSGQNGKTFRFPKFRTMVVNADQIRDELNHLNEQDGPVFKMRKDPRVTAIGRFLRKYSLDELPQLFCVLSGHMSLVGPRPPIPAEVERYEWWQRRRLSVRPGLTCLWQTQGRNDIGFAEWMQLDLEYIDEWSLLLDIKLLILTIPAVLRGSGV